MFHGTWGYIHTINPELLKDVNPDDLKAKTVVESIKKLANLDVDPLIFMPSPEDSNQFKAVIKSQLAQALMGYIAATDDGTTDSVILNPPPVDPIKQKKPDINMLKLMVASDNSSSGIGDVLSSIIGQTNLDDHEFFARLQLMEGDLGTCLNLESLRALRKPSNLLDALWKPQRFDRPQGVEDVSFAETPIQQTIAEEQFHFDD
ncbi:hypothetical protein PCASD_12520 [Puccinia coronata f. sp. avenae]|uniref:DUF6589 domain-containing protein n=1 Tax=Puccinia coronata f. sp. avenae TaxID=200324 RepID=A0A2N5U7L6_9BASI|nr:hypothetical protein PCASD_12520 [Puccinia coronata f. sp. avenae]